MNGENPIEPNPAPEPQPTSSPAPGQLPLPQMPKVGWSAKNKKWAARFIIVAIIFGGAAIYAYYQNPRSVPLNPATIERALSQKDQLQKTSEIVVTENQNTANTTVSVKAENGDITVVAHAGQGYTHLARQALAEYLKSHPAELSPVHKIYVEDYLQKHLSNRSGVHPGDQVTFSESQINDAISSAQALTAGQLANLHQYAVQVPSLK